MATEAEDAMDMLRERGEYGNSIEHVDNESLIAPSARFVSS
jgi:hypothetical protein